MVGFSPADAKRISDAVRRVERMPLSKPAGRGNHVTGGEVRIFLGKTNAVIAKGSSGQVSRYEGGSETDTGIDDTCKNRFANVASGKWVAYVVIDSAYYLIAAEC